MRGRPYAALVLAGGAAGRLGGADKPAVTVGARTLLDRVLAACSDAASTVVVGPRRATYRPVGWVREDPPGGGPLAALHAGVCALAEHSGAAPKTAADAAPKRTAAAAPMAAADAAPETAAPVAPDLVLVVSADLPFLDRETVHTLLAVPQDAEAAVAYDGREQPLLAAYRLEPLRRELALLRTEYGQLSGLPLRMVLEGLELHRVTPSTAPPVAVAASDCDTWEDIATARARIREHDTVLDEWMGAVKAELGIDLDVDTAVLLDLARDAAHGVARPAAPLTTFLVGYAAARADGSPEDVARAASRAARLAERWADETAAGDSPEKDNSKTPGDAGGSGNAEHPKPSENSKPSETSQTSETSENADER